MSFRAEHARASSNLTGSTMPGCGRMWPCVICSGQGFERHALHPLCFHLTCHVLSCWKSPLQAPVPVSLCPVYPPQVLPPAGSPPSLPQVGEVPLLCPSMAPSGTVSCSFKRLGRPLGTWWAFNKCRNKKPMYVHSVF